MDQQKIANYEIIEKLEYRGMAVLYLAKDQQGEEVLVKVIPPDIARDREFEKRFTREMQVVQALNHPNIIQAVGYGLDVLTGTYYLATEHIGGKTLQHQLNQDGKLPVNEALKVVREVAQGLQHACEKGVVHRDIKPENIHLLDDGTVKISNFGLAKFSKGASLTEAGTVLGSPLYISPEQAKADGGEADIRSDIYSLGITLYHMLAGKPPFENKIPMRVIQSHIEESIPPLPESEEPVSPGVFELLAKMTSKNPDNRYSTPAEIIEAIDKTLGSS